MSGRAPDAPATVAVPLVAVQPRPALAAAAAPGPQMDLPMA